MTEFRVWECLVCGFIYDEAKGWPDDSIEPGTRWEDVPEDWLCPDCGVGKADFEMMDIGPSSAEDKTKPEAVIDTAAGDGIVVIGTGLAAYNLVREFRKLDRTSAITMITRDDGNFYSKPQISTAYTIKKRADELVSAPAETMALDLQLDMRIFTEVTAIDTQAQFVIANGQPLAYSKLVLAWGADCISLPLRGNGLSAVYQVNDLLDYNRFRTALAGKRKVLLIGAGLIGSEYANDLANGGYEVEAVDPLTGPLATLLPKAASQAIQRGLESLGVKYHFGTVAQCIDRHGSGIRATLANGDYIDADIVLSAVGIRSRVQLAQQSGIATNKGIVVNRLLETSAKNVYALGDCAEVNGHVLYYLLPLLACAKSLASTLAGSPARVSYDAMPVKVKTPACPLTVLPVPAGVQGEWVVEQQHNDTRALFYDKDKVLRGFALTGSYNSEVTGLAKQIPALME